MTDITKIILRINQTAEVIVKGTDINNCEIEWLNGTTPISKSEIEAMIPVVEKELKDAEAKKIAEKEAAKAKLRS